MRILYLLLIRTSGNNTTLAAISHIIEKKDCGIYRQGWL